MSTRRHMKIIRLLAIIPLLMATALLASCSKDEPGTADDIDLLMGQAIIGNGRATLQYYGDTKKTEALYKEAETIFDKKSGANPYNEYHKLAMAYKELAAYHKNTRLDYELAAGAWDNCLRIMDKAMKATAPGTADGRKFEPIRRIFTKELKSLNKERDEQLKKDKD